MLFEVEQKFWVPDFAEVEATLTSLGAQFADPVDQVDTYFAHPARNFSRTDEALRIRRVDAQNWITYKGPKLDQTTKTRRELELPLPAGHASAAGFAELLAALSFVPAGEVRKRRRPATVLWQGAQVHVAFDEVAGLGSFVELELSAPSQSLDAARTRLASLAQTCCLKGNERRSYLELLLEQAADAMSDGAPVPSPSD